MFSCIATILKPISIVGFLWIYYLLLFVSIFTNVFRKFLYKIGLQKVDNAINPFNNVHQDVLIPTTELVKCEGYDFQIHEAQTQDGAYVSLWRVKPKDQSKMKYLKPVLIQHGLLDCSMSWFIHQHKYQYFLVFRQKGLPYSLASEGFDVWVGNNRGTKYSQRNCDMPGYWNYNIDSFAKYDQPALINKVLKQTGKDKLIYIGHSQGATQFLIAQGIHPQLQSKVQLFFGMGAVISLQSLKPHVLLQFLDKFKVTEILQLIGFKCILDIPNWMSRRVGILCCNLRPFRKTVLGFINFLCGKPDNCNINKSRIGILVSHQPGGTSPASIIQWIQGFRYGKLRKFDYGKKQNLLKYGNQNPPQYHFNHMKQIPYKSFIYRGTKDALIKDKDFDYMIAHFNKSKLQVYNIEDYAHLDYAWGENAYDKIYKGIISIIKREDEDLQIFMMRKNEIIVDSSNISEEDLRMSKVLSEIEESTETLAAIQQVSAQNRPNTRSAQIERKISIQDVIDLYE